MDAHKEPQDGAAGEDEPKRAKTLIETAYRRLRQDILAGVLEPGGKLRVEHLRALYGIGSSTLREALTQLMADALVTAEGQRGFRVAPISIDDLADVTRLRKMMETLALREAIARGDDQWEAGVVAAFHRLSRIEERLATDAAAVADDWEDRNRLFHEALIAACTSRWVRHFRSILYFHSERYRRFALVSRSGGRDVHGEHQGIMEACLARDADRACRLTEIHIDNTFHVISRLLEPGETASVPG